MANEDKQYITAYRYDCDIEFHSINNGKKESIEIKKNALKYLLVIHDYSNFVMPIIYAKMNIFSNIYDRMIKEQGKSKLYIRLTNAKKYGGNSILYKNVIEDEFDYYMTDDPNTFKTLDETKGSERLSYRSCLIGLIKLDLQKINHRIFEGVYKNTNSMSLIQSATSGFKMVIQPFTNNKEFKQLICPTLTSIGQLISYINSKAALYNGGYTYYMDFDRTYLRSNDGKYIDAKDGGYESIHFNIKKLLEDVSLTTGMVERPNSKTCLVYLTGTECKMLVDRVTSSIYGNISAVNLSTDVAKRSAINLKNTTNVDMPDTQQRYISIDENAAENMSARIKEKSIALQITKIDLDSSIFTLNKEYYLDNNDANEKFNGRYYMAKKEEMYLQLGAEFACQMTITLNKCIDENSAK